MRSHVDYWSEFGRGKRRGPIRRVVIHAMGEFIECGGRDYFGPDYLSLIRCSAHVYVTPSGVEIRQRRDEQVAYHAAEYNDDALGIEFLVPGVHTLPTLYDTIETDYLSGEAFDKGVEVVSRWVRKFGDLSLDKHSTLAHGRKKDPGAGFPYDLFIREVDKAR